MQENKKLIKKKILGFGSILNKSITAKKIAICKFCNDSLSANTTSMSYRLVKVHKDAIDRNQPRIKADSFKPKKKKLFIGENQKISKAVTHFIVTRRIY